MLQGIPISGFATRELDLVAGEEWEITHKASNNYFGSHFLTIYDCILTMEII